MKPASRLPRQLAPGDKLGKYELIRQIAVGGMAELYLARTTGIEGFEKLVAVKRILPQHASNAKFVDMFLNEARLAATLHHPNVAQVYDIGREDGEYFFAMEYVHGEDLSRIGAAAVERGSPISLDAALTLAAGLCAGLHYAHDKASHDGKPLEIVHRDVTPSNVLVSYDGAVKLVDFGIARAASQPGTTQGGLKGKIAYMSPEQCTQKGVIDRRSDVFSVGTVLYELTVGELPFSGETEYQILSQIVQNDAPRPSTKRRDYPPALEKIVMRALARNPAQRFATALQLQSALEDFGHEMRLRVSPLVLGRLMTTLFPERIEEFTHAKAQGAFFVEQHVVRTLIETGKTPDPQDSKVRKAVAAARAAAGDDDPTAVSAPPTLTPSATAIGPPPIAAITPRRPPTPRPAPPSLAAATPGTLASSSTVAPPPAAPEAVVRAASPVVDVTERVRASSRAVMSEATVHIRSSKRRSRVLPILGALVVLGGGAAAALVYLRGGDDSPAKPQIAAPAPAPAPPAPAPPPPAPAPPPPPPAAAPEPPPPPVVADEPPPPAPAPIVVEKPKPPTPARKPPRVAAKPRPRPAADTKPAEPAKEPTWNNDSVFMPVRTDKH